MIQVSQFVSKGRHFLSGIARITTPPPPSMTPIRATWSSFFGRQKRSFARMTKILFDDDNDGLNDNFDDNFDDKYDKND